jgi:hypothetical protein
MREGRRKGKGKEDIRGKSKLSVPLESLVVVPSDITVKPRKSGKHCNIPCKVCPGAPENSYKVRFSVPTLASHLPELPTPCSSLFLLVLPAPACSCLLLPAPHLSPLTEILRGASLNLERSSSSPRWHTTTST